MNKLKDFSGKTSAQKIQEQIRKLGYIVDLKAIHLYKPPSRITFPWRSIVEVKR